MPIRLRFPFREIAIIAASAGPASGCWTDCEDERGTSALVAPLESDLQELVDACRASANTFDQCAPLCVALIKRDVGLTISDTSGDLLTRCDLDDAESVVRWTYAPECISGRRPIGYAASHARRTTLGGYFADQARLEVASVRAFVELAEELTQLGAPRALRQACRSAAGDEIVHGVLCARLARRYGNEPALESLVDSVPRARPQSLEDVARDNAVEGCVRETWGALVATWQARAARDATVRATMSSIAPDESSHAELAHRIDRWAMRGLDGRARTRVSAARARALTEIEASLERQPPPALQRHAGLPETRVAKRLFEGFQVALG